MLVFIVVNVRKVRTSALKNKPKFRQVIFPSPMRRFGTSHINVTST